MSLNCVKSIQAGTCPVMLGFRGYNYLDVVAKYGSFLEAQKVCKPYLLRGICPSYPDGIKEVSDMARCFKCENKECGCSGLVLGSLGGLSGITPCALYKEKVVEEVKKISGCNKCKRWLGTGMGCIINSQCEYVDVKVCVLYDGIIKKDTVGLKHDTGKLRYDLIPTIALKALATVLTFGANKYKANSWQELEDFNARYTAALFRHIEWWRDGELYDGESGIHHLAHALCNLVFLLWKNTNKWHLEEEFQLKECLECKKGTLIYVIEKDNLKCSECGYETLHDIKETIRYREGKKPQK